MERRQWRRAPCACKNTDFTSVRRSPHTLASRVPVAEHFTNGGWQAAGPSLLNSFGDSQTRSATLVAQISSRSEGAGGRVLYALRNLPHQGFKARDEAGTPAIPPGGDL